MMTPKNHADWFPFYYNEFFMDEDVKCMKNRHIGAYLRLIVNCWTEGSIPADIDGLASICQETRRVMERLWQVLSRCFHPVPSNSLRLMQKRVSNERAKYSRLCAQKSEAGKKGAQAHWHKGVTSDRSAIAPAIAPAIANDSHKIRLDKIREDKSTAEEETTCAFSPTAKIAPVVEPPKRRGGPKKETDPRVKTFIDWFFERFKREFGRAYIVSGGKDGMAVKSLLGAIGREPGVEPLAELQRATEQMLADSWGRDKASIGLLRSSINKWRARDPVPQQSFFPVKPSPTVDYDKAGKPEEPK